jgi:hypothetical protein
VMRDACGRIGARDSFRSHEPGRAALLRRPGIWALWSAPAERSGDGALALVPQPGHARQSGVALRLPPHSKTLRPAG